ncbi:cobalt-precorrin-8X methylmutase [cyanobacterium endosymbiont of Epithemia clementina EcSB]|uniref:cobalt-precorrin-8X methylmutase n=1 Tax=cyanobacterium endosymbiont of Epithemia clementina EcSB TaxID=3034674 RepID=UPI00248111EC|nr:cobalt-precorrin-8X methylmutase [cyanobacterium endosymbiont of Epithemia clementina EcSB]WGT67797.1 cobalt-precorrin-8X methylmutase [cyanobacterium endosymbiont of Epithemia clementina EcSB]
MSQQFNHPIVEESFAIIDREIGDHSLNEFEYAIARRVIHSTADFDFIDLLKFSPDAITQAMKSLPEKRVIVTDVTMVKQGISTLVNKTFQNPIIAAIEQVNDALPGKTRTETGLLNCFNQYPQAIYVIGNAPTALIALCKELITSKVKPTLIIGCPVGFVSVIHSKEILAKTSIPQIRVEGRKGGSTVASAILNTLLILAYQQNSQ